MLKEQDSTNAIFPQIISMLVVVGMVQLICSHALELSLMGLIFLSTVVAIPVWFYKIEYFLFARRAVLSAGGKDDSSIRGVLWQAQLSKAFSFLVSFTIAILLIAFGSLFEDEHWLVIYVDVFVITGIMHFSSNAIKTQSKTEARGIFQRRFLHGANLIVIVLAITLLDFYFMGAPDLRGKELSEVFLNPFNHYVGKSANEWSGWLIGIKSGIDHSAWYLMQVYIPEVPSTVVKICAWLLFLIPSAISVSLVLFVLLGCLAFLDHKKRKDWKLLGETVASKSFMVSLLILASFYFYGTYAIATVDWSKVSQAANNQLSKISFCDRESISENQEHIAKTLNSQIDEEAKLTEEEINQLLDEKIAPIFTLAEQGIDDYLDWYYSVSGEYLRLYSGVKSGATGSDEYVTMMSETIQEHLFEETGALKEIGTLTTEINEIMTHNFKLVESRTLDSADKLFAEDSCTFEASKVATQRFEWQLSNNNSAGIMGFVTLGRGASKLVAQRISTAIATRAFAKGATKVVSKMAAKKVGGMLAGATTGAALCSPAGPFALVCGAVGATVVWLGVDKAVIEGEEYLYRDEKYAEMQASLQEQRDLLKQQLREDYAYQVRAISSRLQGVVNDTFIPARDGV